MSAAELYRRVRSGLKDHRLYSAEPVGGGRRQRLGEAGRNLAIGLGATSFRGRPVQFAYKGYKIPLDLAEMTGGADDTWDEIARAHLGYYDRWAPIEADHAVLEIGCGIGRDAIHLAGMLSARGRYVGIDVIEPSIAWCRRNITRRHPNFEFLALDVHSEMYNPAGTSTNAEIVFPLADASFDRVVLHSVFTHMFEEDVAHYLAEIRRVLRPTGRLLASFFVFDDEVLASADAQDGPQTFRHVTSDRVRVNDPDHPEAAVAYSRAGVEAMAGAAGLKVVDVHHGFWSGSFPEAPNGQDLVLFEPRD